ncbi:GGDEF domain-containing protein [Stella sp.]|uniref:GGDEF domain-containing protein n=1 Tax=Stella sp. TaxID=2912054 RepID=UPI0035B39ABA
MARYDAEAARLDALHRYDVLDSGPEESFDRITRLAQLAVGTPTVLISLIDRDRQWFKSRIGLDAAEGPRATSFCSHAIEQDTALIVADALAHPTFHDHPAVLGDPHVRFYAGVPLRTPDGFNIGTLCAVDYAPRELAPQQLAVLHDLARLVVDELELRRLATTDSLTGLLTRRAFAAEAAREVARASRTGRPLACIAFDIDHFKSINDRHGHAAGDRVLQAVAAVCRRHLRAVDVAGRLGGEEFAILLPEADRAAAGEVAERLRAALEAAELAQGEGAIRVTASFGVGALRPDERSADPVLERADAAAYAAKREGRNRVRLGD